MKYLWALVLGALHSVASQGADVAAISGRELTAPTSARAALGPSVAVSPEGVVWLSWMETTGANTALRCATLVPGAASWSEARTVATGDGWMVNASDFPCLAVGAKGRATAVWYMNNPPTAATAHLHHGSGCHALFSETTDAGKTWSTPARLSRETTTVEFISLATLADGRVLAAWLDGRAKDRARGTQGAEEKTPQQLYARILGTTGPDMLVDASVCECCQTTLTAFPDGTALLAYRGRGDDELRDIRVARFRPAEGWDNSRALNNDDWHLRACPINGPQLASDGGRVAAAWFTAADNDPRVLASFSPDAGARFLLPLRLDETKAAGRVATVLLHDGAFLVTFADVEGGLWLRRVTPEFVATPAIALNRPDRDKVRGFARMALRHDYTGGKTSAQIVVAFTVDGAPGLRTLLIDVPEGDLLEAEKNCDCAPTAEQLSGFPIRGTIVGTEERAGTLRAKHVEVPGIFAEGEREFRVAPELATRLSDIGRQFLGRIEKRDGEWWLFDVRLIASPPAR